MREQINFLKLTDPESAKLYEEKLLKKNEIDKIMNMEVDISEVKIYPGSDKGPRPEDDPEFYTKWFVENQPKKTIAQYMGTQE